MTRFLFQLCMACVVVGAAALLLLTAIDRARGALHAAGL